MGTTEWNRDATEFEEALAREGREERATMESTPQLPPWYLDRARPRLAAIAALDPLCQWGEMAPGGKAEEARQRWRRLMDEQIQDEIAAGL